MVTTRIEQTPSPPATAGWQWEEIPGTALIALPDADKNVTRAWGGGAWDSKRRRMLIWGGGHGDSYDNSLYWAAPVAGTIGRYTERSPRPKDHEGRVWGTATGTNVCIRKYGEMHPDVAHLGDIPVSRHTYSLLQYIPTKDWFWAYGGALACGSGGFATDTWAYDLTAGRWIDLQPTGWTMGPWRLLTAYDPVTDRVIGYNGADILAYDIAANRWDRLKGSIQWSVNASGVLDPEARRVVLVGSGGTALIRLDGSAGYALERVTTTGATEIQRVYPGVAHVPGVGIVAWGGHYGNVPALDLTRMYHLTLSDGPPWEGVWTAHPIQGTPPAVVNVGTGVNSRLRWAEALGALVLVSSMIENVRLVRRV